MTFDLEAARISSLPEDAFYIPDFITDDGEELLLHKVRLHPDQSIYPGQRQLKDPLCPPTPLDPALPPPPPNLALRPVQV